MTKEQIMRRLFHHCSLNNIIEVQELLKSYPDKINITESNGLYFGLAVSHDSVEMLKVLLDFYNKTKLQGEHSSEEYIAARDELCGILEENVDSNEISSEMQILINKYLYYDAYSDIGYEECVVSDRSSDGGEPKDDSDMSLERSSQSSLTGGNLKHWDVLQKSSLEVLGNLTSHMQPLTSSMIERNSLVELVRALDASKKVVEDELVGNTPLDPITTDEDSTINTKERDSGSSAHTIDDLTKQLEITSLGAQEGVVKHDDIELSGVTSVILNDEF